MLAARTSGASLGAWLGDRCQLEISTATATADELVALGAGLGLDVLAAACARRDLAGPLGR